MSARTFMRNGSRFTRKTRRVLALAGALVAAVVTSVIVAIAWAAPLSGSAYDSQDGNQDSGPALIKDWQDNRAQVTESPDELAPTADVCFGGGLKENSPKDWFFNTSAGGCTPGKSDLFATWTRSEMTPTTSFLHNAFKRNATTGQTFITFELNQSAVTWTNPRGTKTPAARRGICSSPTRSGGPP